MRKVIMIVGLFMIAILSLAIIFWRQYKKSPDYNYFTAKLDIKNGNARIIHVGYRALTLKDKKIDSIASKYGFKNEFIGNEITKEKMTGIKHYNETIETYLLLRNGPGWRVDYQNEIDSLYKMDPTRRIDKR